MILFKLLFMVLCIVFVKAYYKIGGRSAVAHPYPFMVSLQQKTNDTLFKYCSGVIVSESWVLTTAQCVEGHNQKDIFVVAGVLKAYNFNRKNAQTRNVSKIVQHPKYNYSEGKIPKYDLTMLEMNKPFVFQSNVQNATLGKTRKIAGQGEIVGWGSTHGPDDQNQSNDLLYTSLQVTKYDACMDYYKDAKDKFCVGNSEQTACFGDGGTPFVQYTEEGHPIVVGLASVTTIPCGSKPALYTNLAYFGKFISRTLRENE